jgi:rhamnose utilization protein RhaD (predicted bifunctional aldolase and dehydrogenase)/NAD(P)-dependent dehydrogenase (short-subunit alcohol dehydrogenase family)
MQSRFDDKEAKKFESDAIEMRAYTSRILGADMDLVMHGGGNTSVKTIEKDLYGERIEVLHVKGSGHDLATIGTDGFSPCDLEALKKLVKLETLSDTEMVKQLKCSLLNPSAPTPSVEAILHAVIPFKYVDHTHADAVVTISNTPGGDERINEIYGAKALVLPFTMPGFILSKQIFEATKNTNWDEIDSIILLNHGVFTFSDDAKIAYENMIDVVTKAEEYLKEKTAWDEIEKSKPIDVTRDMAIEIAAIRKTCSENFGSPMIVEYKTDENSIGYSKRKDVAELSTLGLLTPDHVIQTKRIPVILDDDHQSEISKYMDEYKKYFNDNKTIGLECLDPVPRYAIWKNKGILAIAPNNKRCGIVSDLVDHTLIATQRAKSLGGWKVLGAKEVFELEYWELEQAKLKRGSAKKLLEGKVAIVTGAASGIGKACAEDLLANGACVVGLDINPSIEDCIQNTNFKGLVCDVTSTDTLSHCLVKTVAEFGGIDILVSNAGYFPSSSKIEELTDDVFEKSLSLNLTSHMKILRESSAYLKLGIDPTAIIIASKNVPAPGPGASAYSVAKAGLTQLGRVAALEMGEKGIRVNMIHPNAVFDTGVWSEEVLEKRAAHYGLSVKDYKMNNVLGTEVTSKNVASLVTTLSSDIFSKTTGAQIPIDGGNERVI